MVGVRIIILIQPGEVIVVIVGAGKGETVAERIRLKGSFHRPTVSGPHTFRTCPVLMLKVNRGRLVKIDRRTSPIVGAYDESFRGSVQGCDALSGQVENVIKRIG